MTKPKLDFVITIDTEEEWDWSGPFPGDDARVTNANELPAFQAFCHDHGVKTTYLVDYAMARNPTSSEILKGLAQNYPSEIGAHLHPWVNPPHYGQTGEFESHVVNLPDAQVDAKLDELIRVIVKNIGQRPVSFRTGRWGIDGKTLNLLNKHGFQYDSSIYPLYSNAYFNCVNAPGQPYWPDSANTNRSTARQSSAGILELPVSVGYNRPHFQFCNRWHQRFTAAPFSWLRLNGVLWHSGIMRKLYLSPELCGSDDMISLTKVLVGKGHRLLHMFLHSSSLMDNATEMADSYNSRERIAQRMNIYLQWLKSEYIINFMTLSEAGDKYAKPGAIDD